MPRLHAGGRCAAFVTTTAFAAHSLRQRFRHERTRAARDRGGPGAERPGPAGSGGSMVAFAARPAARPVDRDSPGTQPDSRRVAGARADRARAGDRCGCGHDAAGHARRLRVSPALQRELHLPATLRRRDVLGGPPGLQPQLAPRLLGTPGGAGRAGQAAVPTLRRSTQPPSNSCCRAPSRRPISNLPVRSAWNRSPCRRRRNAAHCST